MPRYKQKAAFLGRIGSRRQAKHKVSTYSLGLVSKASGLGKTLTPKRTALLLTRYGK